MESFFSTYVWPAAIMIGQSLLLLVALLIFIAYVLYADRKIWAAGPDAAGPERRRPLGAVSILCRPAEVCIQRTGHSRRRKQGRIPVGAAGVGDAGLGCLGCHTGGRWMGHRIDQCRHSLRVRHFLAGGLWRDHGRLGLQLEISVPGSAALCGSDGILRSLHRLRKSSPCCCASVPST